MSGRQAPANLARELLEEIDIVGALGRPADQSIDLLASGPTRMRHWSALTPLRMIVAASAALVGASSRKRRSRSAIILRMSSSDRLVTSRPIEAMRALACAICLALISSDRLPL